MREKQGFERDGFVKIIQNGYSYKEKWVDTRWNERTRDSRCRYKE